MGSFSPDPPKPWVETPLIFSPPISRAAGCNIYLKLENTQPSGSFKSRYVSPSFPPHPLTPYQPLY
jgi:L-serine/L-threonine ammonia-lyase